LRFVIHMTKQHRGVRQMDNSDWLASRFEENRTRLRSVAYRMLGSLTEAEDAVQESWVRLSRSDASEIQNLGGWLTTVVARVCLDMLRSRKSRPEEPIEQDFPFAPADDATPEDEAVLADALGPALLVVLEALAPAERVAFVLHDLFAVPFEEVADILGRSPVAARQLASRARRRVRGASVEPGDDPSSHRKIVDAFLKASRDGDFEALLHVLDPDVVLRSDAAAITMGAPGDLRGAHAVAGFFKGRAAAARPALVGGAAGAVWAPRGKPKVAFSFAIRSGRITRIEFLADQDLIGQLNVEILTTRGRKGAP
jgi:RNA polymerase sigma factor (sigma-70 family)